MGNLIAEALAAVGADGVLSIETSNSLETTVEVQEGMQIDRGYISPQFVTNQVLGVFFLGAMPFNLSHHHHSMLTCQRCPQQAFASADCCILPVQLLGVQERSSAERGHRRFH